MRSFVVFIVLPLLLAFLVIPLAEIESYTVIDFVSLIIYAATFRLGMLNTKYFFFFLIFNMIALPTAINNFIPGVNLGYDFELGAATVPLFTFLDFYCIAGIIRYSFRVNYSSASLLFILIGCGVVFVVNSIVSYKETQELLLLISGLWQVRYILYMYIITQNMANISFSLLYYAIVVSTVFLVLESSAFTYLKGTSALTSGSLGTNSLGNYLAGVVLFLLLSRKTYPGILNVMLICLFLFCVLLTDTRMAILSLLFILLFFWLKSKALLKLIFLVPVFVLSYNMLPNNYKILSLISYSDAKNIVQYGFDFDGESSIDVTPENSPIISRLRLYRTSLNIIYDNPVFGIGPRLWNIRKYDYGFDTPILIDSHNGYLNILSEYGVFLGFMITYLFYSPLLRDRKNFEFEPFIAFIYIFLVSELSNSGTSKYQIFALLVMCSCIFLNNAGFVQKTSN